VNSRRAVIAEEQVRDAFQRGRLSITVKSGDIVTAQALDAAERLNIKMLDQAAASVPPVRSDGVSAARRALYRRHPGWAPPAPVLSRRSQTLGKLALVGAGGVGAHLAHLAANQQIAEHISIVDILPGAAEAVALDLQHASGITKSNTRLEGGTSLNLASDADVVAVSAGRPRTPGMDRSDLHKVNARVIQGIGETLADIAPDAVVIVVTNPVDEMTSVMLDATGFEREKVIGMAGTLDGARFRYALAAAAAVPVADVSAMVLGSHGNEMVPIASRATIRERPLNEFLSQQMIDDCRRATIDGGAAVVRLRKTGSATLAPAHATVELIFHMCGLRNGTVPASVRLNGEYGIDDCVVAVPCKLARHGIADIVELPLSDSESEQLRRAADAIRDRLRG